MPESLEQPKDSSGDAIPPQAQSVDAAVESAELKYKRLQLACENASTDLAFILGEIADEGKKPGFYWTAGESKSGLGPYLNDLINVGDVIEDVANEIKAVFPEKAMALSRKAKIIEEVAGKMEEGVRASAPEAPYDPKSDMAPFEDAEFWLFTFSIPQEELVRKSEQLGTTKPISPALGGMETVVAPAAEQQAAPAPVASNAAVSGEAPNPVPAAMAESPAPAPAPDADAPPAIPQVETSPDTGNVGILPADAEDDEYANLPLAALRFVDAAPLERIPLRRRPKDEPVSVQTKAQTAAVPAPQPNLAPTDERFDTKNLSHLADLDTAMNEYYQSGKMPPDPEVVEARPLVRKKVEDPRKIVPSGESGNPEPPATESNTEVVDPKRYQETVDLIHSVEGGVNSELKKWSDEERQQGLSEGISSGPTLDKIIAEVSKNQSIGRGVGNKLERIPWRVAVAGIRQLARYYKSDNVFKSDTPEKKRAQIRREVERFTSDALIRADLIRVFDELAGVRSERPNGNASVPLSTETQPPAGDQPTPTGSGIEKSTQEPVANPTAIGVESGEVTPDQPAIPVDSPPAQPAPEPTPPVARPPEAAGASSGTADVPGGAGEPVVPAGEPVGSEPPMPAPGPTPGFGEAKQPPAPEKASNRPTLEQIIADVSEMRFIRRGKGPKSEMINGRDAVRGIRHLSGYYRDDGQFKSGTPEQKRAQIRREVERFTSDALIRADLIRVFDELAGVRSERPNGNASVPLSTETQPPAGDQPTPTGSGIEKSTQEPVANPTAIGVESGEVTPDQPAIPVDSPPAQPAPEPTPPVARPPEAAGASSGTADVPGGAGEPVVPAGEPVGSEPPPQPEPASESAPTEPPTPASEVGQASDAEREARRNALTFKDLAKFTPNDLRTICNEIGPCRLAEAIISSWEDDELLKAIDSSQSATFMGEVIDYARMFKANLSHTETDVFEAQEDVVKSIKRLESEGKISLPPTTVASGASESVANQHQPIPPEPAPQPKPAPEPAQPKLEAPAPLADEAGEMAAVGSEEGETLGVEPEDLLSAIERMGEFESAEFKAQTPGEQEAAILTALGLSANDENLGKKLKRLFAKKLWPRSSEKLRQNLRKILEKRGRFKKVKPAVASVSTEPVTGATPLGAGVPVVAVSSPEAIPVEVVPSPSAEAIRAVLEDPAGFDIGRALDVPGFAKFLAEAEKTGAVLDMADAASLKIRFEAFAHKDAVADSTHELYASAISRDLGLSLDEAGKQAVRVHLEHQAHTNPESVKNLAEKFKRSRELPVQIQTLERQLAERRAMLGPEAIQRQKQKLLDKKRDLELAISTNRFWTGAGWTHSLLQVVSKSSAEKARARAEVRDRIAVENFALEGARSGGLEWAATAGLGLSNKKLKTNLHSVETEISRLDQAMAAATTAPEVTALEEQVRQFKDNLENAKAGLAIDSALTSKLVVLARAKALEKINTAIAPPAGGEVTVDNVVNANEFFDRTIRASSGNRFGGAEVDYLEGVNVEEYRTKIDQALDLGLDLEIKKSIVRSMALSEAQGGRFGELQRAFDRLTNRERLGSKSRAEVRQFIITKLKAELKLTVELKPDLTTDDGKKKAAEAREKAIHLKAMIVKQQLAISLNR